MPIYEFVCQHCNAKFEQLMKSSDTPQALCGKLCKLERTDENFGVGDLERVISAPAAVARPEFINREGPSTKQMADSGFTVYKREDPERRIYKKQNGTGPDWIQR